MKESTILDDNKIICHPISEARRSDQIETIAESILSEVKKANSKLVKEVDSSMLMEDINSNFQLQPNFTFENFLDRRILENMDYSLTTQKWIGYITQINDIGFSARLEDAYNPTTYEEGEFLLKEISIEDRDMIKIGAIFYWSVGYSTRGSQIYTDSIVRMQRIRHWDDKEFDDSCKKAEEQYSKLKDLWD